MDAVTIPGEDNGEAPAGESQDPYAELKATAALILERNLARNKAFDDHVALWREHLEETAHSSSAAEKTEGDGYWNLVDEGTGIVLRLMLEYYEDPYGWWHELLHEVVHGEKSLSHIFYISDLFEQWKAWLETGEWKDVP